MIPDFEIKRGKKFQHILKEKVYDNIEFYSPDDKLMFLGSQKKVDWYLKRNLIEQIEENKFKFLFKPKGNGQYGDGEWDKTSLSMRCMFKQNVCVVSGRNTHLTRHHIVPAAYSKYFLFDDYHKNRMGHHDVVLLTSALHEEYEIKALYLKEKLCKKYDITPFKDSCKLQGKVFSSVKQGKKLLDKNYIENNKYYKKELAEYCMRFNLNEDQIEKFVEEREKDVNALNGHYKELSEKLISLEMIQEFCEIWRKHFIDTMKPKFLPDEWSIKTQISPNV